MAPVNLKIVRVTQFKSSVGTADSPTDNDDLYIEMHLLWVLIS